MNIFQLCDGGLSVTEYLDTESVNGGLNPGQTKTVTLRHEFISPISAKYLKVIIDPNNDILELDETNNTATIRVP